MSLLGFGSGSGGGGGGNLVQFLQQRNQGSAPRRPVPPLIPHPSRKITSLETLRQWILRESGRGMFKESEDEYGYYLDSERGDEIIYDSNLYLIFWPKDGHVGPKHLQIAEYGSEGENRVRLDFGLPILFRLGQFDIRHESGSERKLYLLGNYMDPETKQSVPSEMLAAFQNTGIAIPAHTPSPISWDLQVVNPFVILKSPFFRSDDKRWQITIHDQYECFGYVSTNPQDVESLELVSANMANMYRIWEESKLFDPILKAIQQTANLLRREGRDLPSDQLRAWEFSIRKSVEEFYAEADRVRARIPMYAGNQCR